jgi:3-hydroxybutyryl-CoA dehydratase
MSESPTVPPAPPQNLPRRLAPLSLETSVAKTARYAALTLDFNPIHLDPIFARDTSFGQPINHGTLGLSLLTQSVELTFGSCPFALEIRFSRPAFVGNALVAGGEATGEGIYAVHVRSDAGETVIEGHLSLSIPAPFPQKED